MAVYAVCGCTEQLASETAAQAHAAVCALMGLPAHPTTCRVNVHLDRPRNQPTRPCGEPAVEGPLCAAHLAEKRRLS
jgi:hypothetical protein